MNVPIGIATAVLAWRLLEHEEGLGLRHGADVLGAALVTGSLMLGVYTIVEAGGNGWGSAQTLGQGAIALALMAFFLARQAIAAEPLLPLRLFRSRNVSGANVILMLLVAGLFGMFFLGSLYLERVLGYDAIEIGLAFLPVSVGIGVLSLFVSPRLGLRFGPRAVLLGGLTLITLALLWMARLPVDGDVRRRPPAGDAPARRRRGHLVPADHDPRHVRRDTAGLGPALRADQHHAAGRRGGRPRGAGDARHRAQRGAAAGRRVRTRAR